MITTSAALSGAWAGNIRGSLWVGATLSLLVLVQELVGGTLGPVSIAASILLQFVASAGWTVLIATLSRRLGATATTLNSLVSWAGFGAIRGLVGGAVASASGADPEWVYRVAFWMTVSLIWMPLFTYGLAQWDERRRMLAALLVTLAALAAAALRAAESAQARDRRLAAAVEDTLRPALDEIREALRGTSSSIDEQTLAALVARTDELSERTSTFSTTTPLEPVARSEERVSLRTAAVSFELGRPVFAALLTALATGPILLPEAWREGGWPHFAEGVVAILVATGVMIAMIFVVRRRATAGDVHPVLRRLGIAAGGLAGAAVLYALPWEPFESRDLVLIVAFPILFATAASGVSIAVALNATNAELELRSVAESVLLAQQLAHARVSDEEAAAGLVALVRGELNGRLASCAMALSFLATGTLPVEARPDAIRHVRAQLDAVSADLDRVVAR